MYQRILVGHVCLCLHITITLFHGIVIKNRRLVALEMAQFVVFLCSFANHAVSAILLTFMIHLLNFLATTHIWASESSKYNRVMRPLSSDVDLLRWVPRRIWLVYSLRLNITVLGYDAWRSVCHYNSVLDALVLDSYLLFRFLIFCDVMEEEDGLGNKVKKVSSRSSHLIEIERRKFTVFYAF